MNLKKIGKVFTSKFVGTGPSSYKKRIYRAAVSQKLRNTDPGASTSWNPQDLSRSVMVYLYLFFTLTLKVTLQRPEDPDGVHTYSSILSLTSTLDGGRRSTPRLGRFTPGKENLYRMPDRSQAQY